MDDSEYFKITATIKRARERLANLDDRAENIQAMRKIETDNIDRLENALSEPMSINILEDMF